MATGDIQVTIIQVTKEEGTDFNDVGAILAAVFPASDTDVVFKVVPRTTKPGDNVIYDVIAIGRIA